jgi:hypothetical protein
MKPRVFYSSARVTDVAKAGQASYLTKNGGCGICSLTQIIERRRLQL